MNTFNSEQFFASISDVPLTVLPNSQPANDDVPINNPGADLDAVERVFNQLDRLDNLALLLGAEDGYVIPPPTYLVPKKFKLSIVIPVYNESATILKVLTRIAALPFTKEIIVVDDCSTDGTYRILHKFENCPEFTIFYKPKNEGKGAALRTGFSLATGDVVVVQDADLEYDPRDIPSLLRPVIEGSADVVYGSRYMNEGAEGSSFFHRLGNSLLTRASNFFTGLKITDMETCYKIFRRDILDALDLKQKRFGFEPEITAKLARRQCRFQELPISYKARSYAEGKKIGALDLANALYCIVRYGVMD